MKKYLLLPLFALSSTAFANYYIGAEYGYTAVAQNNSTTFFADGVTVSPGGKTGTPGIFFGYRLNDRLAWELGYTQYDLDDSKSRFDGLANVGGVSGTLATKWDADLKASQITIKPVYLTPLGQSLTLKAGLGLSLTEYKYRSSAHQEFDAFLIDDFEPAVALPGGEKKDERVIGGVASVGLDYSLTKNIALGASAQYQFDKVAQATSLKLNAVYSF